MLTYLIDFTARWQSSPPCSGGYQTLTYAETLLGDDRNPEPPWDFDSVEGSSPATLHHFPDLDLYSSFAKAGNAHEALTSIPYLAIITIGATGLSPWNEKGGAYFRARYSNLTPAGQALYDSIQKLYPNCILTLQTWLDT